MLRTIAIATALAFAAVTAGPTLVSSVAFAKSHHDSSHHDNNKNDHKDNNKGDHKGDHHKGNRKDH